MHKIFCLESKLGEEPLVLAGLITFFKELLDDLLGFLTLGGFLESISRDGTLDLFQLQTITIL
jgi:hypothetical protein